MASFMSKGRWKDISTVMGYLAQGATYGEQQTADFRGEDPVTPSSNSGSIGPPRMPLTVAHGPSRDGRHWQRLGTACQCHWQAPIGPADRSGRIRHQPACHRAPARRSKVAQGARATTQLSSAAKPKRARTQT